MRSIGHLPNESQARLFGDYLLSQGIRNEVEAEADGSWLVWVLDDEQLATGRKFLEQFQQNPSAPEFAQRASKAGQLRADEEKAQAQWRQRVHNRRRVFPGMTRFGAGPVSFALVVICAIAAFYSNVGKNDEFLRPFFISYPVNGETGFLPEVFHGEWWRLVTPIFIHFGVAHIVFNMIWLFQIGSMIESVHGAGRFLLLVIAFAVISNLAQYVMAGPFFGGMSGVDYGLFGYVWVRGRCDPGSGLHVDRQNVVYAIGWFLVCVVGLIPHVANYAHAGGLLIGMAWGWISAKIALRNL